MTRPPPVFLLSAASSPVASQESRCPSPLTTRRRNWSRTGEPLQPDCRLVGACRVRAEDPEGGVASLRGRKCCSPPCVGRLPRRLGPAKPGRWSQVSRGQAGFVDEVVHGGLVGVAGGAQPSVGGVGELGESAA